MRTAYRRNDPTGADARARRYGAALRASVGDAATGARVLGVSERLMRDWFNGHPGSPATRTMEVVESVPDPAPLLAEQRISQHRRYLSMNDEQLVDEFFDVLERATEAETRQICAKVAAAQKRDLSALREVSAAEATLDEKLAALCDRLEEKRINPWAFREARRV